MSDVLATLDPLIRCRTDLRGGDEPALARLLKSSLEMFRPDRLTVGVVPRDGVGDGAFVLASWGKPRLLINAHIDTVPPNEGWTGDPCVPRVENGRMIGLGTADTKGAIAAILCALGDERPSDVAVLFSGDEESGGRCIHEFLEKHAAGLKQVIVCEPTRCRVGTRHRGVLALEVSVSGPGGHSSRADSMRAPLAELARLATIFDDWGKRHLPLGPTGFKGMCVNVAKLDGGVAFNVVPAHATLSVSVRCPPNADPKALRAELEAMVRAQIPDAIVKTPIDHSPFHTRDLAAFEPWLGDAAKAPIDLGFWTEAALYADAGIDAVVYGPGDIAQAHAPDEWVEIEQLEQARGTFAALFRGLRARADRPS